MQTIHVVSEQRALVMTVATMVAFRVVGVLLAVQVGLLGKDG